MLVESEIVRYTTPWLISDPVDLLVLFSKEALSIEALDEFIPTATP